MKHDLLIIHNVLESINIQTNDLASVRPRTSPLDPTRSELTAGMIHEIL